MLGQVLLGRYRVVEQLARGGMGVVYLGRVEGAAGFAKPVVIKTIISHLKSDSSVEGMFVREGRILSNLQHPRIVGVLDFGQTRDAYLMVLEYVHGFHLGQWTRYLKSEGRSMQVDHAIQVATSVLDALHYAHRMARPDGTQLGIVHRDVSPANVLIGVDGQVKLHDFGIARMAEEVTGEYRTQDGSFKGTLGFAAPETLRGCPASPQSDLYACAVVLYQALAGNNPFKGRQADETVARVLAYEQPPLASLRDDIPPELDAALACALAKSPEHRYSSAAAFADVLRKCRLGADDEVEEDFSRTVRRDFSGPLSSCLGVPSLEERDRAWRQSATTPVPATQAPSVPPHASAPTIAIDGPNSGRVTQTSLRPPRFSPVPTPAEANAQRRSRLAAPVAAGSVVALVTAGLFLARAWAPQPTSIVVEKHVAAELGAPAVAAPQGSEDVLPAANASAAYDVGQNAPVRSAASPAEPARKVREPGAAAQLSQAFQKQQGQVARCFGQHADAIEGQPRLAVRFSIDRSGKVQSADLNPSSLTATALGSCILAAARATRFPEQADGISFVIPLTARAAR